MENVLEIEKVKANAVVWRTDHQALVYTSPSEVNF